MFIFLTSGLLLVLVPFLCCDITSANLNSNIQANKPVFIVYVPYNVTKELVQQEDSFKL